MVLTEEQKKENKRIANRKYQEKLKNKLKEIKHEEIKQEEPINEINEIVEEEQQHINNEEEPQHINDDEDEYEIIDENYINKLIDQKINFFLKNSKTDLKNNIQMKEQPREQQKESFLMETMKGTMKNCVQMAIPALLVGGIKYLPNLTSNQKIEAPSKQQNYAFSNVSQPLNHDNFIKLSLNT
jgi:hypothetical protein